MKIFGMRLKKNKSVQFKDALNADIQPFKQQPCVNNTGEESADRIDAHDLFAHYTAEIIQEDTIFTR